MFLRPAARRSLKAFLVAGLTLIAAALMAPALASAAQTYVVDSTADAGLAAPGAECETAAAECTLRAAIEASNEDPDADAVEFDENVFEGEAGLDKIETTTGLPSIDEPLEIDGGSCTTSAGPTGPCVEVVATTAQTLFAVSANNTTIRNLAIGDATVGILVVGAENFTAAGNWLGLALDESASENSDTGILVEAGSDDALVGGDAAADANYVATGEEGIVAEVVDGFRAVGNVIGAGPGGSEAPELRPFRYGVYVASSAALDELPEIADNAMLIDVDAAGIVSSGAGALIAGNEIVGSLVGIETLGASEGEGNLIEGNEIEAADRFGIRIENEFNTVLGNTVLAAAWDGILLEGAEADHNRIGGDLPVEENVISKSAGNGGNAIEIESIAASRNEVAANRGVENEGSFIELSGHANGDIQPPAIASALQSSASGTGAKPNATIRLFRKQTTEAGEVAAFLGKAVTDSSGSWKATFSTTIPVGSLVAATQTSSDGGTSEVSAPISAAADSVTPSCATSVALCPPSTGSVASSPPPVVRPAPKPLKCKKGFAKKKVKGKPRCVKLKKKHKGKGKRPAVA